MESTGMCYAGNLRKNLGGRIQSLAAATLLIAAVGCGGGGAATFTGGGNPPPSATATISTSVSGPFGVAMSTSFQPAEWDYTFFQQFPSMTTTLGNLNPAHIRLQAVSEGVPQGSSGTTSEAWDFSIVDAITQPVLSVGDHSPEFQIAKAPAFMYVDDNYSNSFQDLTFAQFAGYTQNLVKYYSTGGFTSGSTTYVSPAYPTDKVTWWGIYNEPNINNNLTPQQYVTMYNTVVPAMLTTDPSIKLVGLELADFSGQVSAWVPPFVQGVNAQVNAIATHFYSTCNQKDTDQTVFESVPGFATDVQTFYSDMQAANNPNLNGVPVWVTENNVNADYDAGNGMSACNPGQTFVTDLRGSSAFFAAWRPYVFSQLGKAGIQALYHWDFGADQQFGEVNATSGQLQLSYWVDYWLQRMFPSPPGGSLLSFTQTDDSEIEILPVKSTNGTVVIMIANHAINDPTTDDNGPGVARTVQVDVSALGNFSSASQMIIDTNTSVTTGPTSSSITPAAQMTVTLNGYGVAFLTLNP